MKCRDSDARLQVLLLHHIICIGNFVRIETVAVLARFAAPSRAGSAQYTRPASGPLDTSKRTFVLFTTIKNNAN